MIILLVSGCDAFGDKADIPRSWIEEEASINDIHEHDYSLCINLNQRLVLIEGEHHPINLNCKKGTGNPFKHALKPGYKVYRYNSPKEYWEGLSGSKGFVLEIDGEIVETITTTVN
jgi:hypothetical protein